MRDHRDARSLYFSLRGRGRLYPNGRAEKFLAFLERRLPGRVRFRWTDQPRDPYLERPVERIWRRSQFLTKPDERSWTRVLYGTPGRDVEVTFEDRRQDLRVNETVTWRKELRQPDPDSFWISVGIDERFHIDEEFARRLLLELRQVCDAAWALAGRSPGSAERLLVQKLVPQDMSPRTTGLSASRNDPERYFSFAHAHLREHKGGPGPEMPMALSWMQSWGPRACALAHFPPPPECADAIFGAWPDSDGGWTWQLTKEPLDLLREDHRAIYGRAREVFAEVNNRDPRSPWPSDVEPWTSPLWGEADYIDYEFACPARTPGDRRPIELVEALEEKMRAVFPPSYQRYFIPFACTPEKDPPEHPMGAPTEWNKPRVPDREAFLLGQPRGGIRWIGNMMPPTQNALYGRYRPRPGYLYVRVALAHSVPSFPNPSVLLASEWLEMMARILGAYWGMASVGRLRTATYLASSPDPRDPHPDFLPLLKPREQMPDVFTPYGLGCVNYWSEETCRRVGFPPDSSEGELSHVRKARRAEHGGWVWQIKDEPFEGLFSTEDRAAIMAAYERFPVVGGRAPARAG